MTQNAMDFIHITASVTVEYVYTYHMLQVGGREEICIIVLPCREKRVSFWFDSSHDRYASGLD